MAAYHLAVTLAAQQKTVRAIAELEALHERQPDIPEVANSLAVLYLGAGLVEPALALFERLLEREPTDSLLHYNIGVARRLQGDRDAARAAFAEVLRLEPEGSERRSEAEGWLRKLDEEVTDGGRETG